METDTVTIAAIPNPDFKPDGFKAYQQLVSKYGFKPTKPGPLVTVKDSQRASALGVSKLVSNKRLSQGGPKGEVPAEVKFYDLQYLCPVTIGTPGKVFKLNFDTGSADLWLWSTALPPTIDRTGHTLFDPSQSQTFQRTEGSSWQLSYRDLSSASGFVGTDTVILGGLEVKNQSIELADKLSISFQQGFGDGLLGLAYGLINKVTPLPVATVPENLIIQKKAPVKKQIFTAYLSSYRDANKPDGNSFFTFGHINKKALGGQKIHYAPVDNSQGLWQFPASTASIGDRQVSRFDNTAIADTGSSLALIDDALCKAIYDLIPGAYYEPIVAGYVYPTNTTIDKIPDVRLAVGSKEFAMRKADFPFADVGLGLSYGSIQSRGDLSFDIYGDAFLKAVYAIFDIGKTRFGVVSKKASAPNSLAPRYLRGSDENPSLSSTTILASRRGGGSGGGGSDESSSTSLSRPHGLSLAYGTLILSACLLPARGSIRFLLAAVLCLFLLQ